MPVPVAELIQQLRGQGIQNPAFIKVAEIFERLLLGSGGGSGGITVLIKDEFTIDDPSGMYEYVLDTGDALDQIWLLSTSTETAAKIGTVLNGEKIMSAQELDPLWLPINVQTAAPATIYFEGFFSVTKVIIFKRSLL